MKKNYLKVILIVVIITLITSNKLQLNSQQLKLSNWKVHTSMLDVRTAVADSRERIWLGTTGGLVIYDKNENSSDTILLNHSNGLLSSNIRKICSIPEQKLLIAGTFDGVLEIINEDLDISHITAIRDQGFSNAAINDIIVHNNKAYIAGGWGLAEFDFTEQIFTATVENIGDFQKNTAVNSILIDKDTLWAATTYGLAAVPLASTISMAKNWKTFYYPPVADGTTPQLIMLPQIIKILDTIYLSSSKHIYSFSINTTGVANYETIFAADAADYNNIIKIGSLAGASGTGDLLYATAYQLIRFGYGEIFANWDTRANGFDVISTSSTDIVYNYTNLGAALIKLEATQEVEIESIVPNTPLSSYFISLAINSKGNVFGVSDNSQNHNVSNGIMGFDGQTWTNYNKLHYSKKIPILVGERITAISVSPDDVVYACGWGGGLFIFDDSVADTSEKFIVIDEKNSPLTPIDAQYRIAGETAFDKKGRPWTLNYGGNAAGTLLFTYNFRRDNTGNIVDDFIAFENKLANNDRSFHNITIDSYGTKWLYSGNQSATGVLYFNDKDTPANPSDDIWKKITTSSNPALLDNVVNCIAVDNFTSQIWIGTQKGITRIYNPYAAASDGSLMLGKFAFLANQSINYIMVDAVGNKWIATNLGIFVLNQAGDDTLTSINMNNSPLVTNEVFSIVMDSETGVVYIGTKTGLYSVQTSILRPNNDYSAIRTYPSPFKIDKDLELTIDGLVSGTELRILTPDGRRVRTIFTDSKRAIWNGKDDNGCKVPPGVYIVVSSSAVTGSSAASKIAVVE